MYTVTSGQAKNLRKRMLGITAIAVLSATLMGAANASPGVPSPQPVTVAAEVPTSLTEPSVALFPLPLQEEAPSENEGVIASPDAVEAAAAVSGKVISLSEDITICRNWLVKVLTKAGFSGKNLREAWALVMRESGGREDAISSTGDYGMFQFNRAAWSGEEWWNTNRLLTREYNAKVAYRISEGGKTWYPWDINGQGKHLGRYTSSHTYSKFKEWYKKYPC